MSIADLACRRGPLAGHLVLELCGDEPSGTFATQILGDLGATVLKLERVPAGEPAPTVLDPAAPVPRDIAYFFGLNRNKRSLCLDMKAPEGRALLHALVRQASIFHENHRPGAAARLGADAATLRGINPDLVHSSVSGFGQTGPWSRLPAYDATVQALGGGMSITGTGREADPPVRWGNPIGGIGGALYAVLGMLVALRRKRGASLDVALLDTQLAMQAYRVPPALTGARYAASPHRGGNGAMPYGPFLAGDGSWFVLGITAQFWPRAAALLGHPEWLDDPRFATEAARQAHAEALNQAVGAAMQAQDADEWQRRFVAAGIPGAKVQGIADAFGHPHVALRDMLVGFEHPLGARLRVAGDPIRLSDHQAAPMRAAPGLGADTVEVLTRLLGIDAAGCEALRAAGIVWWPLSGEVYARPSVV